MLLAYGDNYFLTRRPSTNYEWAAGRGRPIFSAKYCQVMRNQLLFKLTQNNYN